MMYVDKQNDVKVNVADGCATVYDMDYEGQPRVKALGNGPCVSKAYYAIEDCK